MEKIAIDENLRGKELFRFLVANKQQLIAQKKAFIKRCDPVASISGYYVTRDGILKSATVAEIPPDATSVNVKVVANTSLWCDSQMDVLLRDSAAKSIKQRKGMIPHLHDHIHEIDAQVGDVLDIYYQDLPLIELGYQQSGTAQALIFNTDIRKSYNESIFNKYKAGKINQHSIGLQYTQLELAINDEESIKEMEFWNKYAPMVINQDAIQEKGYFWVVPEYKLLENSCVLFGANELTPTISVNESKSGIFAEPAQTTQQEPSFDLDAAIKGTKFLIL